MKTHYNVKVKGKFKNKDITMSIPVKLDLESLACKEALAQAEYDGLSDVNLISLSSEDPDPTQMEIPFEPQPKQKPSDGYTTYSSLMQNASDTEEEDTEDEDCEDEDCESEYVTYSSILSSGKTSEGNIDNKETTYTPYSALKTENPSKENEAISFVPRFNNGYTPYLRKIITIPNSFTKHKFE